MAVAAVATLMALLSAPAVSPAGPVRVSLAGARPQPIAGRAWTARLTVRPASFAGVLRITAIGPRRFSVSAAGRRGSYRARLIFPAAGRWTLTAAAGASSSKLGAVVVRAARRTPLVFAWPTSVEAEPGGTLLVVENGLERVTRADAATGRTTTLAAIPKAYAVARGPSGSVFVSAARDLLRVDGAGAPVRVAEADADIGPLAISPGADVYFAAGSQVFVLRRGAGPPALVTSARFSSPHGLAATADGSLLVSDTGNDTVWRIDPGSGATTMFAAVGTPRGLDVAPDGSVYVVDARDKRIVHLSATGGRLGLAGPAFADPYDLDVAPDGAVYVVDTAASGRVFRVMGEIAKPLSRR